MQLRVSLLFLKDSSMKHLVLGIIALTMVLLCTMDVDARDRRKVRRNTYFSNFSNSYTYYNNRDYSIVGNSPQAIAESKVTILAARGFGGHIDNSNFGGGYYEGWGVGATAEIARKSTCNGANCRTARGSATAWSSIAKLYFAVNIW